MIAVNSLFDTWSSLFLIVTTIILIPVGGVFQGLSTLILRYLLYLPRERASSTAWLSSPFCSVLGLASEHFEVIEMRKKGLGVEVAGTDRG